MYHNVCYTKLNKTMLEILHHICYMDRYGTWYIYNFSPLVWSEQHECEWMINNQSDI